MNTDKYIVVSAVGIISVVALLDQSILGRLMGFGLDIAAPVVTLFAMWLAHRLIKAFESKTKIDVPAKYEEMIDAWVLKGVHYAEEKGRNAIAAKGPALAGPEKLELAAGFVADLAERAGFADMAKDKIMKLVESKLSETRVEAPPTPTNPTTP
jgi:hypothetical protein